MQVIGLVWSERILVEAHDNLGAQGRYTEPEAERRKKAIRETFAEGEVTGFEYLEPSLQCHEKDRHVLAAAIRGSAEQIVTFNLKDFPATALLPHDIRAIHPDDFFLDVLDLYPELVMSALRHETSILSRPTRTVFEVIELISNAQCPMFAQELRSIERAAT